MPAPPRRMIRSRSRSPSDQDSGTGSGGRTITAGETTSERAAQRRKDGEAQPGAHRHAVDLQPQREALHERLEEQLRSGESGRTRAGRGANRPTRPPPAPTHHPAFGIKLEEPP